MTSIDEAPQYQSPHQFSIRFQGDYAEVESELQKAEVNGRGHWCGLFRDIHHDGLADRAPFQMLDEFASAAPSELLRGYIVGIMFAQKHPDETEMPPGWPERLVEIEEPSMRGCFLGQAFMVDGRVPLRDRLRAYHANDVSVNRRSRRRAHRANSRLRPR